MIAIENMTDAEFEAAAFDLLRRELGVDGLARFLRRYRGGKGDYTAERSVWQRDLRFDNVADVLRARQVK